MALSTPKSAGSSFSPWPMTHRHLGASLSFGPILAGYIWWKSWFWLHRFSDPKCVVICARLHSFGWEVILILFHVPINHLPPFLLNHHMCCCLNGWSNQPQAIFFLVKPPYIPYLSHIYPGLSSIFPLKHRHGSLDFHWHPDVQWPDTSVVPSLPSVHSPCKDQAMNWMILAKKFSSILKIILNIYI